MKLAQIQFSPWDKIYNFDPNGIAMKKGDRVLVGTDLGQEIGEVIGFLEVDIKEPSEVNKKEHNCASGCNGCASKEITTKDIKPVLRLATSEDLKKKPGDNEKEEAIKFCKGIVGRLDLPMKIIDAFFSYDGSRLTFAFTADSRVDFREMVKELTHHFNRTIRLQQIGIRDEARVIGDYGHCGRSLCCRGHLRELTSITSEMADAQQCAHRGSDRLSGACGRLMCCLAYEEKGYIEMGKTMPAIGAKVNVDGKKGVVIGHHILKQSVDVEFPSEKAGERNLRVEVDLNRNKKK